MAKQGNGKRRRRRASGSQRRQRLADRFNFRGPMSHAPNGTRVPIIIDGQHVADVVRIGGDLGIERKGKA